MEEITQKIEKIEPFLKDNYVIFQKNGKIEMKKIPDFGSLTFTSQNCRIVQIETIIKEK